MEMKTSPLALLKHPSLLNGVSRFDVLEPATGRKLADVANFGPLEVGGE